MKRYTEAEIGSELHDQPEQIGIPQRLFICSTPRSGSYMLCRYMINAGLGVPYEYFNPILIRQMAPRLGLGEDIKGLNWFTYGRKDRLQLRRAERADEQSFLSKYVEILLRRRCQGGVFAAKIHFRDFHCVLDNPIGQRLFDGAVFVYLHREDLLKQAVSEHFGQLSGRWGIDDAVTTTPATNPDFYDVDAIDRALWDLSEQERGWRVFLARNGAASMTISYEQLCKDPVSAIDEIARRLGVDSETLRHGYREDAERSNSDANLPDKADVARHYLVAARKARDVELEGRTRFDLRGLFRK